MLRSDSMTMKPIPRDLHTTDQPLNANFRDYRRDYVLSFCHTSPFYSFMYSGAQVRLLIKHQASSQFLKFKARENNSARC